MAIGDPAGTRSPQAACIGSLSKLDLLEISMHDEPLRLLVLGAHPDDAEYHAGGLATLYCSLGHTVKLVSVTNGAAGHHQMAPEKLSRIRREEARSAGRVIGATYDVWDFPDGGLTPSLEVRARIIREIREYQPHLVLTHRPCDYHPDHRAVGQAVQDASYMVKVPLVVPESPAVRSDPVVAYMNDLFTKPYPLQADVVINVEPHVDSIIDMLACHESQVYQWLPYVENMPTDQIPSDANARHTWLRGWFAQRATALADRYRQVLIESCGDTPGRNMAWVEVYEISEYATAPSEAHLRRLFPGAL